MPANGNGEFLRCVQELEEGIPKEMHPVFRRLAVHIVGLEQSVRKIIEDHTDLRSGQPFDVRAAMLTLEKMEPLMAQMTRALTWAQAGMWIAGIVAPVVLGLAGYVWWMTTEQMQNDRELDAKQTEQLTRLATLVDELEKRAVRIERTEDMRGRER